MKNKMELLLKVSSVFWLIAKVWSYKTWVTDRLYPVVPPFDFLENIPNSVHLALYVLSLLGLGCLIFMKPNRLLIGVLFAIELLSCLLDTLRWQPWEYMYMCILLMYIINFNNQQNFIWLVHLLLVSIYIFSGFHKLSRDFLSIVWYKMILLDFAGLPVKTIVKYKLYFVGLIIPVTEILCGLLLLFSKKKIQVSYFLAIVHIIILMIIGPFGLKYNSIVWPWNIAMIFILLITYYNTVEKPERTFYFSNFYWVILWFIMPILSFSNNWYQYFSFNLYSGKGYQMYFCVEKNTNTFEPYIYKRDNHFCDGKSYVNLQMWAFKEVKSAPIPETEIYWKINVKVSESHPDFKAKVILYNHKAKEKIELN